MLFFDCKNISTIKKIRNPEGKSKPLLTVKFIATVSTWGSFFVSSALIFFFKKLLNLLE